MTKTPIDIKQVENLALLGLANEDIADILGVSASTVRRRFKALLAKSRGNRRAILRKYQWEAAKKGSASVLIWLGKNELGQRSDPAPEDTEIPEVPLDRG